MIIPCILLLLIACVAFGLIDKEIGHTSVITIVAFITLLSGAFMLGMLSEKKQIKSKQIEPKNYIKQIDDNVYKLDITRTIILDDSTKLSTDSTYILIIYISGVIVGYILIGLLDHLSNNNTSNYLALFSWFGVVFELIILIAFIPKGRKIFDKKPKTKIIHNMSDSEVIDQLLKKRKGY